MRFKRKIRGEKGFWGGFDKPSKIKALERRFLTGQDWYNKENDVNFLEIGRYVKVREMAG